MAAETIAAVVGGNILDTMLQNKFNKENYKHRVQWTVDDAKKAGIHPLAALGANLGSGPSATVNTGIGEAVQAYQREKLAERDDIEKTFMSAKTRHINAMAATEEAKKDLVMQQLMDSKNAMANQKSNAVQDNIILDSEGKKRVVGVPGLAEEGEKHYGELWEFQNLVAYIKDALRWQNEDLKRLYDQGSKRVYEKRKQLYRDRVKRSPNMGFIKR